MIGPDLAFALLEVWAYTWSLTSLLLLTLRRHRLGYLVGAVDIIPWSILALTKWASPWMLVVEFVYLGCNSYGLWRNRRDPWLRKDTD